LEKHLDDLNSRTKDYEASDQNRASSSKGRDTDGNGTKEEDSKAEKLVMSDDSNANFSNIMVRERFNALEKA
jgi:hypothetical protein